MASQYRLMATVDSLLESYQIEEILSMLATRHEQKGRSQAAEGRAKVGEVIQKEASFVREALTKINAWFNEEEG